MAIAKKAVPLQMFYNVDRFGLLATTEKNAKNKGPMLHKEGTFRIPPYFFPHYLIINFIHY